MERDNGRGIVDFYSPTNFCLAPPLHHSGFRFSQGKWQFSPIPPPNSLLAGGDANEYAKVLM